MVSQKFHDFYKRWDISLNEEEKWVEFKSRFMNSYSKILGWQVYKASIRQQEFFEINGINTQYAFKNAKDPSVFRTYCNVYETLFKSNGKKFIQFVQSLFWMNEINETDKDLLFEKIQEDISVSQVPLRLIKTEKDFLFYPSGVKLLDEKLVDDNLKWLVDYPKAYSAFTNALKDFEDKTKLREVVDNLRLSLELFLKEFLENNKSLENQQAEIGKFLKSKATSPEIGNLYWTLIDSYSKYQNANAKHNNSVKEHEVEFILYLTGSFIRFLIPQK